MPEKSVAEPVLQRCRTCARSNFGCGRFYTKKVTCDTRAPVQLTTSCDASTGRSPAGRAEGLAARKGIAGLDGREVRAVSTAKISKGSNDSIAVQLEEEHVRLPHVQARGAASHLAGRRR